MAKRKSKGNQVMQGAVPVSGGNRMHLGIDSAENGYVIRVSGEHDGKYHEKTLVATSPRQAFRVAAAHIPSIAKKVAGKKKNGKEKRFAAKRG